MNELFKKWLHKNENFLLIILLEMSLTFCCIFYELTKITIIIFMIIINLYIVFVICIDIYYIYYSKE